LAFSSLRSLQFPREMRADSSSTFLYWLCSSPVRWFTTCAWVRLGAKHWA
jgi:hypothetical protein